MAEYPKSFIPIMVQAILEDRKTNTRRIASSDKPPYQKGDRLWVQENYQLAKEKGNTYWCHYDDGTKRLVTLTAAEAFKLKYRKTPYTKKQPGRFMYKSCSRLWLEVTDIFLERLQDISEEDAIAEGIEPVEEDGEIRYRNYVETSYSLMYPSASFHSLWESIYGRKSWLDDPFVWVIKFKKLEAV
jgi:hypothetical protein